MIGQLFVNGGGIVTPGDEYPGILTCSNVVFSTGSTLSVLLQGTNEGTGYDQLNVRGTVLINPGVNLSVKKSFAGATNDSFLFVRNDGGVVPSGTFNGHADASTFSASGSQFQIVYGMADLGNGITLKELSFPPSPQFFSFTNAAGILQFSGTGTPGLTYSILASTNLSQTNWTEFGIVTPDKTGAFGFTDEHLTNHAQFFYRLQLP